MLKYIKQIEELRAQIEALSSYNNKNWLLKLFTKKPECPHISEEELIQNFTQQYPTLFVRMNNNSEYAQVSVGYKAIDKLPLVTFKAYLNGCYYISRAAFKSDGSTEEWGCPYPYSECGITGLVTPNNTHLTDLDPKFKEVEERYIKTIEKIKNEF